MAIMSEYMSKMELSELYSTNPLCQWPYC